MKDICFIIYDEVILSNVSGVLDMLTATNGFLESCGKEPVFNIRLVSEKPIHTPMYVPSPFISYHLFKDIEHTDLVIAPAFYGDPETAISKNTALIKWIGQMRAKGTEVASLCLGSYFLAEAGILNGKPCTSHWMAIDDMRIRYPEAEILSDMVMTDQEGIYTSGGAFLSLNLILYLIEKFCGREVSIWTSKMFSIDINKVNQSHFAVFQGQRRHEDEEILKAQDYIEKNYHLQISTEQVADMSNMSKRNFIRRFKSATQNTPLEYLQRVKIESAKKALEKNSENINSLMYNAGYNDIKTFRTIFKRITGLTPHDYRKKYSRN